MTVIRTQPPTDYGVRGTDPAPWGSGAFGASRDGGARVHTGLDYLVPPGGNVYAVAGGVVVRIGLPYDPAGPKGHYRLVEIASGPFLLRTLYVDPSVSEGTKVAVGELIGRAQDIARAYPNERGEFTMSNHVHLDVRVRPEALAVGGSRSDQKVWIDPGRLISWGAFG